MGERDKSGQEKLPNWARAERQGDFGWIQENLHAFWPIAKNAFQEMGRGAIVVDTTEQPVPGAGNPFGYFSQAQIEQNDAEDTKRLVREYTPQNEFVVMLLKHHNHTSTYRVRPQRRRRRH